MRSSEFMRALPDAVARHLPTDFPSLYHRIWSFGCQFYDDDPRLHYEVVRTNLRFGDRLELGLHFESRSSQLNQFLLAYFQTHLIEIKATLGEGFEAEPWDRGWTKVYETIPLAPYDHHFLEKVGRRMAQIIVVLHPMFTIARYAASTNMRKRTTPEHLPGGTFPKPGG